MDGAEGNIWTQDGGSERSIVLGGMFGHKRRKLEKDSAGGNVWTQEGGSERRMVMRGIFGPKREEVSEG